MYRILILAGSEKRVIAFKFAQNMTEVRDFIGPYRESPYQTRVLDFCTNERIGKHERR